MNSMRRQNDRTLQEELPWSVGAQYATGDQWRNNSRMSEEMEPKQKQHPVVDVTGDRSKVRCSKEQYCIGTWSMNQGKLEVVKQEMARVNVDILGISELKWTGMGEFNSGDHYIYYCGHESLRRNGVAIIVNKRVRNEVLGCNLKNDRMISVHFQGKLEVVKQEMARVNVNILGISELKWTGIGEFNSDDHYIYYCGQASLRRNGVAIMVNKRV